MRALIFSDTHLTCRFDERKYKFLKEIIGGADRVVINGDFWDSWFADFDSFLNSRWSELFPLLLAKKAVYIYGNHDPKEQCDERVSLFSVFDTETYTLELSERDFKICHGHQILDRKRGGFWQVYSQIVDKKTGKFSQQVLHYFLGFFGHLGWRLVGRSLMADSVVARRSNQILKTEAKLLGDQEYLVCGDTHCAEIDNNFINLGCIDYGIASYALIEDGQIRLLRENY
jgi:predicted phosphodiesterase